MVARVPIEVPVMPSVVRIVLKTRRGCVRARAALSKLRMDGSPSFPRRRDIRDG
jgi:hypothetical protein